MAKMIKLNTIDDGYVWVNRDEIAYITKYKGDPRDRGYGSDMSLVTMRTGRRFKVYGSPDYVMMYTVGT